MPTTRWWLGLEFTPERPIFSGGGWVFQGKSRLNFARGGMGFRLWRVERRGRQRERKGEEKGTVQGKRERK